MPAVCPSPSASTPASALPAADPELAARRLLILMLILLGISSVIAVIIPNPRRDAREREAREDSSESDRKTDGQATGSNGKAGGSGKTTGKSGDRTPAAGSPDAGSAETGPRKVTLKAGVASAGIKAEPGERLILTVKAKKPSQVIVPGLGLTGFADRWAPAVFDLILPDKKASLPVFTSPPTGQPRTRLATIRSD